MQCPKGHVSDGGQHPQFFLLKQKEKAANFHISHIKWISPKIAAIFCTNVPLFATLLVWRVLEILQHLEEIHFI